MEMAGLAARLKACPDGSRGGAGLKAGATGNKNLTIGAGAAAR